MERYKDNGLCEFIKENCRNNEAQSEIKFFDTDKSLLVVASKREGTPLCLIIDDRIGKGTKPFELTEEERCHGNLCFQLARQARLPLFWIRYTDCEILKNEDFVYLWQSDDLRGRFERIPLKAMVDVFRNHGIEAELEYRTPQKRKNDSLSSAFHIWQRECLRVGIFADLDLIRMRGEKVVELIELKRSGISFQSWRPYNADINNFAILSNFCAMLGNVDFHIVYNTQVRNLPYGLAPGMERYYKRTAKSGSGIYYDKIDYLKIFRVERREDAYYYPLPYPVLLGTIKIEDFLDYDTYQDFIEASEDAEWTD